MKRILAILVSIAVMLSLAVIPVAAADDSATTVTVETLTNEVKAGDTVTLAVTIANNTGFTDFQWNIEYDENQLDLSAINTTYSYSIPGHGSVSIPYISGENITYNVIPNVETRKIVCGGEIPFENDSTLFTLTFIVKEDAAAGKAEVKIVSDRFASDGEFINANYVSGGVTVVHACGNGTLVPAVEATCTDPSVDAYYVCSCKKAYEDEDCQKEITNLDDWKSKNNDALGHTEDEAVIENEVSGDCEKGGSYDSVVYCTVCGEELSRDTYPAAALGHDYEGVITAPTETKDGYTTYTCTVCGDSYIDDIVPATGTTGGSTTGGSTTGGSTTGGSTTGGSTTGGSTTGGSTTGGSTTGDISVVDKSDNDTSDDIDGATWLFRIEGDSIIMTVEHELACVVIIQTDDETFVPVKAIENDDGSYDFDISGMMTGSDVIIAIKGDFNLDGEITMDDASGVMNAWVNNTGIDDIARIASDVDNSDKLDMNDASNIMNAWVNDTRFSW